LKNPSPIEISSVNGNYFATFHTQIENILELLSSKNDVYVLIDQQISEKYQTLLSVIPADRYFVLESTEENKSLAKVEDVAEWMMNLGATKTSHLVGIGGGVVQDLATFVSHIYYRGIEWTFVPTTLLSQADSCIGAKCALNLNGHKNQLGVVHTPSAVEIFTGFLDTLPLSEIQSGFGEIAKLSVTGKDHFLKEFRLFLSQRGFSTDGIGGIIHASLLAKKYVIDQDEYESDLRRILNYGHSFGHALESLTNNKIIHGDAVIVGMDIINFIGRKMGITSQEFFLDMKDLMSQNFGHIVITQQINAVKWVNELKHDKKMRHGKMNFAIPVSVGDIQIFTMELDGALINLVGEYIEESNFFHSS
jgi:3-dehydroquinate synthase